MPSDVLSCPGSPCTCTTCCCMHACRKEGPIWSNGASGLLRGQFRNGRTGSAGLSPATGSPIPATRGPAAPSAPQNMSLQGSTVEGRTHPTSAYRLYSVAPKEMFGSPAARAQALRTPSDILFVQHVSAVYVYVYFSEVCLPICLS